jgi:predicted transcriptional regulator
MAIEKKSRTTEDILRVEGVKAKGFGVVPKVVMRDRDLSMFAKAIYAYFCSLSGKGDCVFPGRDLILANLKISKDAYYAGLKELINQGYISVEQENAGGRGVGFRHNVYTILAKPQKYANTKGLDTETSEVYRKIMQYGLDVAGYGVVPYAVMCDERIRAHPKAVYAYISSMVGNQHRVDLNPNIIAYDMGVKDLETIQRMIKKLRDLNLIDVTRVHADGRFAQNRYYINSAPDLNMAQTTIGYEVYTSHDREKQDAQKHHNPKKQDPQKQDPQKQDTLEQDATRNSLNQVTVLSETDSISMIDRWINEDPTQQHRRSEVCACLEAQMGYNIMAAYNYGANRDDRDALDALVLAVAEVMTTNETRVVIGGQPMLVDTVRAVLGDITNEVSVNVLERFLSRRGQIDTRNHKSYLLTSVYRELTCPTPNDWGE